MWCQQQLLEASLLQRLSELPLSLLYASVSAAEGAQVADIDASAPALRWLDVDGCEADNEQRLFSFLGLSGLRQMRACVQLSGCISRDTHALTHSTAHHYVKWTFGGLVMVPVSIVQGQNVGSIRARGAPGCIIRKKI